MEKANVDMIVGKLANKLSNQLPVVKRVQPPREFPLQVAPRYKYLNVQGLDAYYEDLEHVYFVVNQGYRYPLISVTTFLDLFSNDFEEGPMSYHCARKKTYEANFLDTLGWEHLSIDERAARIRKAWSDNSIDASSYGTAAHMGCEYLSVYPGISHDQVMEHLKLRNPATAIRPIIPEILKNVDKVLNGFLRNGYQCVAEPLLIDSRYCLAGQSDLVMLNHQTKKIWILDYKTNSKRPEQSKKAFNTMLGYFSSTPDTDYYHYCIQLTLYAYMLLDQYPGYEIEKMTILWLNPETGEVDPIAINSGWWMDFIGGFRTFLIEHSIIQQAYNQIHSCL